MLSSSPQKSSSYGLLASFLAAVLWATASLPVAAAKSPEERALLEAERNEFQALTGKDIQTLDHLLSSDLTYIHPDGRADTKSEFLSSLQSGRLVYKSIKPEKSTVQRWEETALITGTAFLETENDGKMLRLHIRFSEVYRKANGRWVLALWQATPLQ